RVRAHGAALGPREPARQERESRRRRAGEGKREAQSEEGRRRERSRQQERGSREGAYVAHVACGARGWTAQPQSAGVARAADFGTGGGRGCVDTDSVASGVDAA